jgi:hypothetical protein
VGIYASFEFHEPTDAIYTQPILPAVPDSVDIDAPDTF